MEKGLLEKTGKPLDHWIKVVKASGIEKHKAIIDHLKSEHGFTYGFANFVAHKSRASDAISLQEQDTDLVSLQYQGKESLKPIYDALHGFLISLGDDVQVSPKKGSVSYIRKKQFALIKPATKKRIDLGLKIKDRAIEGRLEDSGPFGSMCTHRVRLESVKDVDQEVKGWIQEAYDASV